ncbi:protein-tyrosine phosphatase-like protein [Obelidium mucronatum]|nr:protein-tyrosine phosphatase-like protein [Obelidium mucronatum]
MPETSSPETISKPEHVSIITEYLCLGSEVVPTASNAVHQLKEMNITHVLNMAKEVRDEALMVGDASTLGIEFKWIGVYDHPDEEIDGPLREGVAFIDDARKSNPGAIVLVHCKAGRSRSVAVVLAYLIMVQKMTLKAAYELVSTKRNGIIPNIGFMLALLHIELETLGYNTEVSGSSLNGMKSI